MTNKFVKHITLYFLLYATVILLLFASVCETYNQEPILLYYSALTNNFFEFSVKKSTTHRTVQKFIYALPTMSSRKPKEAVKIK